MTNINTIFKLYYEWWKNIDKFIFILIVSMFSLGLFFSLVSTSIIASDRLDTNTYYFFIKHLSFIILAIILLIGFSFLNQDKLYKFSKIFFVIAFFFYNFSSIYRYRSKRIYKMVRFTFCSKI